MSKTNKAKSFAEEGLEDIMQETAQLEQVTPVAPSTDQEEELEQVGGLEPIEAFYQDRPYTGKSDKNIVQYFKGLSIKGIFEKTVERQMRTKEGRQFISKSYHVRKEDNGQLVSLSSTTLERDFNKLSTGDKIIVTCTGYNVSRKNGKEYPNFLIFRVKAKK